MHYGARLLCGVIEEPNSIDVTITILWKVWKVWIGAYEEPGVPIFFKAHLHYIRDLGPSIRVRARTQSKQVN